MKHVTHKQDDPSEDIFEEIAQALVDRSIDQSAPVRVASFAGLGRLQNPTDPSDDVFRAILRGLKEDKSKDVRKAALKVVGLSNFSLPVIITRARDHVAAVRTEAFSTIHKRVPLRTISISDRAGLIRCGLRDRNPQVKRACEEMCRRWLDEKKDSLVTLVECLNPEAFLEECETLVLSLLSGGLKLPEDESPPFKLSTNEISTAKALIWRMACKHASEERRSLDDLLPDAVAFCDILEAKALFPSEGKQGNEEVGRAVELLGIAGYLDATDEV
eukprot:110652-Amorphochlora_amoeboformis.AAC.1